MYIGQVPKKVPMTISKYDWIAKTYENHVNRKKLHAMTFT
jgi:hypothetical protein